MKDAMIHNNYRMYLQEVKNICVNCTRVKCWEDTTNNCSNVCPIFNYERNKLREKYYGKGV